MNKLEKIITEEISKLLKEIGDSSANSYPFDHTKYPNGGYIYRFTTEDNDKYLVWFKPHPVDYHEGIVFDVSFQTENGHYNDAMNNDQYNDVVNKGRLYKVMSTLTNIINDFILIEDPHEMFMLPNKKNDDDLRSYNLYKQYIQQHVPNKYYVELEHDSIGIIKKWQYLEKFEGDIED